MIETQITAGWLLALMAACGLAGAGAVLWTPPPGLQ